MKTDSSASALWAERVEAHHRQSALARKANGWPDADPWEAVSSLFMADPLRTHDQVLNLVSAKIDRDASIIDVGGGASRYALPLANAGHRLTVIEPSAAMCLSLQDLTESLGSIDLSVVQDSWEDAKVEPADVVLCSHVLGSTPDAARFIGKLADHARSKIILVESMTWPLAVFSEFWAEYYGEKRTDLPGIPEIMALLWEMGITPDLEMLEPSQNRAVPSKETALALLKSVLFLRGDVEEDSLLLALFDQLTEHGPEGYQLKNALPRRQGVISWVTGGE